MLALNLLHYHAAAMLLNGSYSSVVGTDATQALAYFFLDLHAHGYDLALLLFGCHCLLLGYLIFRSGYLPKTLGVLSAAAGLAYFTGTGTRFLAPQYMDRVAPIYIVAFLSETALCVWLLSKGVNPERWKQVVGPVPQQG